MKSIILVIFLAVAGFSQGPPLATVNNFPFTAAEAYAQGSAMHLHGGVAITVPFGIIRAEDAVVDMTANTVTIHGDSRIDLRPK